MGEQNEVRQDILEVFRKLGLENKEERTKLSFGASLLDDDQPNKINTEYIVLTPSRCEVYK